MTIFVAASTSQVDVQAAVNLCTYGDEVRVPAGSSNWGGTAVTITKAIKVSCVTRGTVQITSNAAMFQILPDATTLAGTTPTRITNLQLNGNNTAPQHIIISGAGVSATAPYRNVAIGNCDFSNSTTTTSGNGAIEVTGQVRGVVYNCTFDRCNVIAKILGSDSETEWTNSAYYPFAYGSGDQFFFEDCSIAYSSAFAGQDPGWTETGQGSRAVFRYSSWNFTNATTPTETLDFHGFQNYPGGQTGTMVHEVYGNTFSNCNQYRCYNLRGSWGLMHNNVFTGIMGGPQINQNQGCLVDVPSAPGHYQPEVNNSYFFNNTINGTITNLAVSVDQCGTVAENSRFWNYNSSFNGSVGIGRGTAAPSGTCSLGVGYWQASTPTPTVSSAVIQNATLWQCQVTNTYTPYYTPYTYPHPLRNEGIILAASTRHGGFRTGR